MGSIVGQHQYKQLGNLAGALVLSFALWLHAVTEKYYDKEIAVRLRVEVLHRARARKEMWCWPVKCLPRFAS